MGNTNTLHYSKWAKCSSRLQHFMQKASGKAKALAKKPLAKMYQQYYRIRNKFLNRKPK